MGGATRRCRTGGLAADGRWAEILGVVLDRTVGPAWIGYASAEALATLTNGVEVRVLAPGDAANLERFKNACTPDDWENVAGLPRAAVLLGAFTKSDLSAVAGYEVWGDSIAHLAVLTHPSYRRRGMALAAVRTAATIALEHGLVPQYRSLATNLASLGVADALGFTHYATTLAVRFGRPSQA